MKKVSDVKKGWPGQALFVLILTAFCSTALAFKPNTHDIGDAVLSALGNILLQSVRQGDYLARWGGEEFVLVCKETSYENALRTAEKLRDRVARQAFALGDGRLVVNISLGVATVKEDDSFETALKRADEALYLAKASGRNCVMSELDIAR